MGELAPLLGTGGGLGALALVVIYLLASNRHDRKQAGEQVNDAEKRADAAEDRAERLQRLLDESREQRRAAEDREAELAREVKGLREEVERLRLQVERLQEQLT